VKSLPIFIIFGTQHSEETYHQRNINVLTSPSYKLLLYYLGKCKEAESREAIFCVSRMLTHDLFAFALPIDVYVLH